MKQWNLQYKSAAGKWVEALPLGNGHMGAMVYGGCVKDRISLNLDTLWSGNGKSKGNEHQERDWEKIREWIFNEQFSEAEEYIKENVLGDWTEAYMPAGSLWITVETKQSETQNYLRKLNLNTGIYQNCYDLDGKKLKKEMFTSMEKKLLAVKISSQEEEPLNLELRMDSLLRYETEEAEKTDMLVISGRAPVYAAPNYYETKDPIRYEEGKGIRFALALKVVSPTGTIRKDDRGIHIEGTREVVLYLSGGTDFSSENLLKETEGALEGAKEAGWKEEIIKVLSDAEKIGYETLKERHIKIHRSYFERVELELGEQNAAVDVGGAGELNAEVNTLKAGGANTVKDTLELVQSYDAEKEEQSFAALMFHYGRYLLIASSAPGSQCANLQGIWNESLRAPWSSNYTVNINTEMNYWMAESCNLSEFHQPLFELIERTAKSGEKTAKTLYGLEGWVSHHNVDLWGHSTPVGRYADNAESCVYAMWNMSSGWLCRHLWEHYCYTRDFAFLKEKAFPLIEGAVKFYLGYLVLKDGYLLTVPSTSPENMFCDKKGDRHSVAEASTMDISILKEVFGYYIEACEILQVEGVKEQAQEALKLLPPFKTGSFGQLQEWYKDWDESDVHHRHVSHLYGIYPAYVIKEEEPSLLEACKVALERRGDEGTGWCITWKACLWARLKDGNRALRVLSNQMRFTQQEELAVVGGGTYTNLFCAHPPFQIDGNFGYTAAVTEMLLQSHTGVIELLPALPDIWKAGRVKGLKARGGYEVSFAWKEYKITEVTVRAEYPGIVRIRYNGTEQELHFTETENIWHSMTE